MILIVPYWRRLYNCRISGLNCPPLCSEIIYLNVFSSAFCYRRLWSLGRGAHRVPSGKVAVRLGGVLSDPVPESADKVRQIAAAIAVVAHGLVAGNRAALLRAAGRQDADRDAHQGHAAERQQLQLALHIHDVTLCLAAASFRIILHVEQRHFGA